MSAGDCYPYFYISDILFKFFELIVQVCYKSGPFSSSILFKCFLSAQGTKVVLSSLSCHKAKVILGLGFLTWRTAAQEQLIVDNHKLVLLAALSDSLDYLSDSAQQWVSILSPYCLISRFGIHIGMVTVNL